MAGKAKPDRIVLHRAGIDNAGRYRDAGTELTIGNATGDKGHDVITADRATELLDSVGAAPVAAEG